MNAPDTGEDTLLLPVPRAAARELERILLLGLIEDSLRTGGKPTPLTNRIVRQLHTAATQPGSAPATTPPRPPTVDPGVRKVFSVAEAAELLGCNRSYVRRLCLAGRLPAQRTSAGWVIDANRLDDFRHGRREDTDGIAGPAPADRAADSPRGP